MGYLLHTVSVGSLLGVSLIVTRACRQQGRVELMLSSSMIFSASAVLVGYLLSELNSLSRSDLWCYLSLLLLVGSLALVLASKSLRHLCFENTRGRTPPPGDPPPRRLARSDRLVVGSFVLTTAAVGAVNLIVIALTAPHNWDSMTYHLARIAYFVQNGSLGYFDANYWAQVTHPRISSVLLIYTYIMSGHQENWTQLVQFVSYWMAVVAVYGIARKVGADRNGGLIACLAFALLIECIMQSTTTQNDMLVTAYIGCSVYFLLAYKESRELTHAFYATLPIALAIGVKESALLVLPSVLVIAVYCLLSGATPGRNASTPCSNRAWPLLLFLLLTIVVFALPSGYLANYRMFGHPLGPEEVRGKHLFDDTRTSRVLRSSAKNMVRYGYHFISLDGLPPVKPVRQLQKALQWMPRKCISAVGVNLESSEEVVVPFGYDRAPQATEDRSYWGVLGFALIWPAVILSACGILRSRGGRALSTAAIVFLIAQACAGKYDPYRGRYFVTAAVFAAPVLASVFASQKRLARIYVIGIVLMACLCALSGVVFRKNSCLIPFPAYGERGRESVFGMDRIGQLTRTRPNTREALRQYDTLVPKEAVVAVCLGANEYEYPLFGERLTRTVIPINSFWRGRQPIPDSAQYLVYTKDLLDPQPTDMNLGGGYWGGDLFLRRLR